jgi:hypothetical protein
MPDCVQPPRGDPPDPIPFPGCVPGRTDAERMLFIGQYVQAITVNPKTKGWNVWVDSYPYFHDLILVKALDMAMDAVLNPPGKV